MPLLLTVDTSGKHGSVALARATTGTSDVELLESVPLAGGTFSAHLVPQISSLLSKNGCDKSGLDAFVAISGPGSFTGLRVGLAAIKALAEVLRKPIAAVSRLEAIACSAQTPGPATAVLDAGRGDVYVGEYDFKDPSDPSVDEFGERRMLSERLLSREEFLAEARGKLVVTPDSALAASMAAAGIGCRQIAYPSPGIIASLGWSHIRRGKTMAPDELEANYIRRSDAEIFSQRKC